MRLPRLLLALAMLASVAAPAAAQDLLGQTRSDLGGSNAAMEDPGSIPRDPGLLWEEVDNFYANQQWMKVCARLDRLHELGESIKRKKQKAGYAYLRCAAIHVRVKRLAQADQSLELSRELIGEPAERRPVEAELHRILGQEALFKNDLGQALAHFEIAAAKYPDTKKDTEVSLLLSKYAKLRLDAGDADAAREATYAALGYYPENREAQKVRDTLEFWSRALWPLVGLGAVGLGFLVFLLRRRGSAPPTYGA